MSEEVSNKINYFDEYMTEQIPIIQKILDYFKMIAILNMFN